MLSVLVGPGGKVAEVLNLNAVAPMLLTKLPVKQLKMVLAMPLSGLNSESPVSFTLE